MPEVCQALVDLLDTIKTRSAVSRQRYVEHMQWCEANAPRRAGLSCSNLAHTYAAMPVEQRDNSINNQAIVNLGIVTAYNDMLSAHQPYGAYPDKIKAIASSLSATVQVAGGVPAMCDGITQGQLGMELSLYSRDVIAQATAVALSHAAFDGVICLGICDKIVPGLLIGALQFGYLPTIFIPSGPMTSGISNSEKAEVRQRFARGEIDKKALLASELKCYHSAGTCTFYGTANTNELMLEFLGLQLPGSSFPNPETELREALTASAVSKLCTSIRDEQAPALYQLLDERAVINAMIGILVSGGSTNHTIHLVAIAKAAGIQLNWDDFQRVSDLVPLLTKVYPNGSADVNDFHRFGGIQFLIDELQSNGLLFGDCPTIAGSPLSDYRLTPAVDESGVVWSPLDVDEPSDMVLRKASNAFSDTGGICLLKGNLGRAIVKTSAVDSQYHRISAPAEVFTDQNDLITAYKAGKLNKDFVAVLIFQGPKANGMPELHKLMPTLANLQDAGHRLALLTDGRLSGASGKILSAIHCVPEAVNSAALARIKTGDLIEIDVPARTMNHKVDESQLMSRDPAVLNPENPTFARPLFASHRHSVSNAEEGATILH